MPKKKSIGKLHAYEKLNESANIVVREKEDRNGRTI